MYKKRYIRWIILLILVQIVLASFIMVYSIPGFVFNLNDFKLGTNITNSHILQNNFFVSGFKQTVNNPDIFISTDIINDKNYEELKELNSPMTVVINSEKTPLNDLDNTEKVIYQGNNGYFIRLDIILEGIKNDLTWKEIGFTCIPDASQKVRLVISKPGTIEFDTTRALFASNMSGDYDAVDSVLNKSYQVDNMIEFINKNKDSAFLIVAPEYLISSFSEDFSSEKFIPLYPENPVSLRLHSYKYKNIDRWMNHLLSAYLKDEDFFQNSIGLRSDFKISSANSFKYAMATYKNIEMLYEPVSRYNPDNYSKTEEMLLSFQTNRVVEMFSNTTTIESNSSEVEEAIKRTEEISENVILNLVRLMAPICVLLLITLILTIIRRFMD